MDISGVSIPVTHEVRQEPPQNAQLQNAVREPQPAEQQQSQSSGSDSDHDNDAGQESSESNLGKHINEHA